MTLTSGLWFGKAAEGGRPIEPWVAEPALVDRTCFAVMERLGIERVATLDSHFSVYRFGTTRTKAFRIVR